MKQTSFGKEAMHFTRKPRTWTKVIWIGLLGIVLFLWVFPLFFFLYFCNIYRHELRIAVPVLEIIFDHASSSSFCHYPMPMVGACQGPILALVFLCLGLEHRNSRQTVETNLRLTWIQPSFLFCLSFYLFWIVEQHTMAASYFWLSDVQWRFGFSSPNQMQNTKENIRK